MNHLMVQLYSDLAARTDGMSISASPQRAPTPSAMVSPDMSRPSGGVGQHEADTIALSVAQSQLMTRQILSAVDGDSVDDL